MIVLNLYSAFYHFHKYVILHLMRRVGDGRIAKYKEGRIPDTEAGLLMQYTQYANPDT